MPLVPPGAVGLKFWRPDAVDKRTRNGWNVEDKSTRIDLSNGDKIATKNVSGVGGVHSTLTRVNGTAGKYYAEFLCTTVETLNFAVGAQLVSANKDVRGLAFVVDAFAGGIFVNNVSIGSLGRQMVNGDVVCLAWDAPTETFWFRYNNSLWNNDASADPATGINGLDDGAAINDVYSLFFIAAGVTPSVTLRTELADFTYTVPSGFTSWMGEAVPVITGVGDLAADVAAVSGTGDVGAAETTGTGALAADAAAVSAVGVSESTGTGALAAQDATAAGVGVSASSGAGALAAQAAAASGVGAVVSIGTGALAAASATASGTGVSASTGTGALRADAAVVVGAGASASTGTGSLVAGSAEVAGTGTAAAGNAGVLVAQEATVAGLGVSVSTGSGALQAGAAAVAGVGLGVSTGIGALVASPATVVGEGVVLDAGAVLGIGALVAGAATIAGAGEVTGEVAPPIFVGGGGGIHRPQLRPEPVEGVGYGILPQVEGEAFGLVVAVGAGVATLPRLAGAAAGTVGVAGRSAARLAAVKAAALGDRGQTGAAAGLLKSFTADSVWTHGAHGTGSAVIQIKARAIGRHDDDEAAIVALLLAA